MRSWEQKIIRDMMAWKAWRKTVVGTTVAFTNGCFDIIHFGHIQLLQKTKLHIPGNTTLVVGINSDESVRQLKGANRPLVPEAQRLAVIAAMEMVDYCLIFPEKRCDRILKDIRPDVWVKGGDYTLDTLDAAERKVAKAVNAEIKIIQYEPGISTTTIINRT